MDHIIEVQPGAEYPIPATGDYIYCKFVTHPVRVLVNGQPVTMEAGDKWRVQGGFSGFQIANPDNKHPARCIFTVGQGDFNRQIVQGNISITPGIRKENGEFIDDTRHEITLGVVPASGTTGEFSADELVTKSGDLYDELGTGGEMPDQHQFTVLENGDLLWLGYVDDGHYRIAWPPQFEGAEPEITNITTLGPTGYPGDCGPTSADGIVYIPVIMEHPDPNITENILWLYRYEDHSLAKMSEVYCSTDAPVGQYEKNGDINWVAVYGRTLFYCAPVPTHDPPRLFAVDNITGAYMGELLEGSNVPALANWGSVVNGKLHLAGYDGNNWVGYVVDAETWNFLDTTNEWELEETAKTTQKLAVFDENTWIGANTATEGGERFAEYTVNEWQISAWGYATPCTGRIKPGKPERTSAKMEKVATDEGGRVKYSGELIRAALELYAGRTMPSDYLDFVYAVELQNLDGLKQRKIQSGGMSFAGAEINDAGTAWFPQTVTITVRRGLL